MEVSEVRGVYLHAYESVSHDTGSDLLQIAGPGQGSLTVQRFHLSNQAWLFKQTGPALAKTNQLVELTD